MIYGFVCFGKEELKSKFLFDLIFCWCCMAIFLSLCD